MKRRDLPPLVRAVVHDLITDARCARRDARQFPATAADLLPYADECERIARAIRTGAPYHMDRYGMAHILGAA